MYFPEYQIYEDFYLEGDKQIPEYIIHENQLQLPHNILNEKH